MTINEQEKEQVKTIIVDLMLKVPETQKLLKETIKVIADVEFPLKWPSLLPVSLFDCDMSADVWL